MSNTKICVRCEQEKELDEYKNSDLCVDCIRIRKYNKKFLESYCRVKNITLLGEYDKVDRTTMIRGECTGCGGEFEKGFRTMVENNNSLCTRCKNLDNAVKRRETLMREHKVENVSQLQSVKDKKEKASLEKFGTRCTLQAKETQEKTEKAMLAKFGKKNAGQVPELREKIKNTCIKRFKEICPAKNKDIRDKISKSMLETQRKKREEEERKSSEEEKKEKESDEVEEDEVVKDS